MARRCSCRARRRPRPPRSRPAMHSPALRVRPALSARETAPNHRHDVDRGHANRPRRTCSRFRGRARMNPSRVFILRPVATTLLMVAILIVGAIAYLQLPLSALPEVAYPTIQVQTFYPGASPEVMTSSITAPLERQFGQMPSLNQMSSTSAAGASVITLQFGLDFGLNIDDLRTTIATANVNTPKGNFDGPTRAYTINANDQLKSAGDYRGIVVAYKDGAPVLLSDVATVVDSAENVRLGAWMNDVPAVILNVQRQPGANVIAVVDGIKQLLPQLQASLPSSV